MKSFVVEQCSKIFNVFKRKLQDTFVVDFYSKIFGMFGWISILKWLELIPPLKRNKAFIDTWVLGNFFFSIICLTVIPINFLNLPLINLSLFLCYGFFRLFEMLIVQINLLLFDQYRAENENKKYFITDFRRTVLLLIHNYLEIIVWFALIYRNFQGLFRIKNEYLNSVLGFLYFSLVTMTTLGTGDIIPKAPWGIVIVIIQTLIGIFMALLLLARFVALLPKPEERKRKAKGKGIFFLLWNKRPPK